MITKFKLYESVDDLKVGDYVICNVAVETNPKDSNYEHEQRYKKFIRNNIGQYVKDYNSIISYPGIRFNYLISYDYIPEEFNNFIRNYKDIGIDDIPVIGVERSEILVYSNNKEDLEIKLNANKYNL